MTPMRQARPPLWTPGGINRVSRLSETSMVTGFGQAGRTRVAKAATTPRNNLLTGTERIPAVSGSSVADKEI
jgi:hypothetical protein